MDSGETGETSVCHHRFVEFSAWERVESGVWSIDDITITITITGIAPHNSKVTPADKLFNQSSSND